jgi:DNA-binding transcriptional ArsR family regulator
MRLDETQHYQDAGEQTMTKFFAALADPTRIRLLKAVLSHGELGASECIKISGLSQGRTSVHLNCLVDCGLLTVERIGRRRIYRPGDELVPELLEIASTISYRHYSSIASCLVVSRN